MRRHRTRFGYAFALSSQIEGMWGYLLTSVVLNLIFKLFPLVIGLLTSYMIGASVIGDVRNIWQMFVLVAVMVVLSAIFSYLDILVSHYLAYRILTKLRNAAYDKIDELAPAAMEGRHSGELISIVLEDVELLEWFYAHTIAQLVVAVLIPLAALILMGLVSPVLPMVMLPFILALVYVPARASKKANTQGSAVRESYADLNARIVDGVQGLKDIISFQWQNTFLLRFADTSRRYYDAQLGYAMRGGDETRQFQTIMGFGALSGQMAICLLVLTGQVDALWLLPMVVLCGAVFSPLQDVLTLSISYGLIFAAAKRLFDLFQARPSVADEGVRTVGDIEAPGTAPAAAPSVSAAPSIPSIPSIPSTPSIPALTVAFDEVSFTYPSEDAEVTNRQLLRELSFTLSTGETLALVGASGCGKTTVARLLQRFWDVDEGTVTINGTDIREIRLEALRELITVVPQESYLFNMSVAENLRLARLSATGREIEDAATRAQADVFIRALPQGYGTVVGERGLRLSGGERQRLSIAQAFLKDSPILVLDEASANLDSETERQINRAVNRLKEGRATLVIAHRVSTIRAADRIAMIREGRIEATGTYGQLIETCPSFAELIGSEHYAE